MTLNDYLNIPIENLFFSKLFLMRTALILSGKEELSITISSLSEVSKLDLSCHYGVTNK